MKEIELSAGKVALVDDEEYEKLKQFKWTYHPSNYAYRHTKINGKIKKIYMHRAIMGDTKELEIDHINHNGLDNRKENLRICTQTENHRNQKPQVKEGKYSKYKGVSWDKSRKKWIAYITLPYRKFKSLGRYTDEKEAALAYNQAASLYFGEYAYLNEVG